MVGPHRRRHGGGDLGRSDDFALQTPDSLAAASRPGDLRRPDHNVDAGGSGEHDGATRRHFVPNPDGGAVNGVEPYPLTYVEYAIAPAQPLLNSDCTANTAGKQR